jgi:hypothetical protein
MGVACRSLLAWCLKTIFGMDPKHEKRDGRRFPCRARVSWSYFNQAESHAAAMLNFSLEGVALEANRPLVNGSSVVMRLEAGAEKCQPDCIESTECPWFRSMVLGQVKWCEPGARGDATASGWTAGVRIYSR